MRDLLGVRIELGDIVIFPEHKTKYSAGVVRKFGRNGSITIEAIYSNSRRRPSLINKRKKDENCIVIPESRLLEIKRREANKIAGINGIIKTFERAYNLNGIFTWADFEFTINDYILRQIKDTVRLSRIMKNLTLESADNSYLFVSEEEKEEFQKKYKIIIPTEEDRMESLETKDRNDFPF